MYTTLDFLVLFNGRRFIVVTNPELKLHTTDEADTAHVVASYRQLASRNTSFIPTSFKSPQFLHPIRARDTAYLKSYATDDLITPCLSPCCVEESKGSKAKIVGTYQYCYKFWLWIFLFCWFVCQNFFSKFFFQNFPHFKVNVPMTGHLRILYQ